jgi:F-type H+-transporting ATPase subunit epsilon
MDRLKIIIIQPQKIVLEAEYDHIIIPGIDGDFGIEPGHTPFITVLRPGIIELFDNDQVTRFAVHDGYVTVENNLITLLCEVIEKADEIDKSRAEASRKRAEDRIKSQKEDVDYRRAEISLKRAMARLQID